MINSLKHTGSATYSDIEREISQQILECVQHFACRVCIKWWDNSGILHILNLSPLCEIGSTVTVTMIDHHHHHHHHHHHNYYYYYCYYCYYFWVIRYHKLEFAMLQYLCRVFINSVILYLNLSWDSINWTCSTESFTRGQCVADNEYIT